MSAPHTAGPWRWEINEKHKSMQLVGGVPTFDLTVMSFERWGMHGAVALMRETEVDGMNIMHRCTDWAQPAEGREHHASWFKVLNHPDARLMAAAPDLLAALEETLQHAIGWADNSGVDLTDPDAVMDGVADFVGRARAAIAKATGAKQ